MDKLAYDIPGAVEASETCKSILYEEIAAARPHAAVSGRVDADVANLNAGEQAGERRPVDRRANRTGSRDRMSKALYLVLHTSTLPDVYTGKRH